VLLETDAVQGITDTHAHLSSLDARGIDADACLDALEAAGFGAILDIGTESCDLAGRLSRFYQRRNVRFAAGIWPHAAVLERVNDAVLELECAVSAAPVGAVAAIGECGYDRLENPSSPREEIELIERQLELAGRLSLPIIVHSRNAARETLETLARFPCARGVIHCFSYTSEEASRFLDRGFLLSFAGNLTYKNAENLRAALRFVPADRLLLETDSPYLAPSPHRGKASHPGMIVETYRMAASVRGADYAAMRDQVAANAAQLFALR
jgi:TatD DNase family protein